MSDAALLAIASALSGGIGVALIAWARERWRARQPAAIETANLTAAAQALATVSAARDELEADNARLRQQLTDERTYYLGELDRVRGQLVAALTEVDQLRSAVRTDESRSTS